MKFWNWLKKLWNKIKCLAKKTEADDILLGKLLDLGIDYFMRHVNGKLKSIPSSRDLLIKFENSIEAKVKATDNKFDDYFMPFLHDIFQKIDLTNIDRLLKHKENLQVILVKVRETILLKWVEEQNRAPDF